MPELTVQPIGVDRLAEVYPLVRSGTRVTFERWEEFGRELLGDGGGLLAVAAPDNCLHGVAAYRIGGNLRHERTLDVEIMVAFDLRGGDQVRETLCRELEGIAAESRCSALNFTVPAKNVDPRARSRAGLERLGLRLDSASFVRELQKSGGTPRPGNR